MERPAACYEVEQADGRRMNWELLGPEASAPGPDAASGVRAAGHHYVVVVMLVAINWVCMANTSLRAAAKCFEVLGLPEAPSFWAIRDWVLRLGLYELQRPKPQARDWVFIVDSTIALSQHKALVILGVRLGEMERRGFNLGHQDVATLQLRVLSRCNGLAVQQELEAASRAVGVPRLIVSDAGSEVKKGVGLFQADHPGVDWNYDLTHRFALFLEKELGSQPWWSEFITQTQQCRQGCQQTAWSPLQPPAPRTKSRWLNVRPLVSWAQRVLAYEERKRPQESKFASLFGWLKPYAARLEEALQMIRVLEVTARQIKHQGLDAQQVEQCAQLMAPLSTTERVRALGDQVLAFLREQAAAVKAGERLLSSSDVLESLFGKYKAVVKRSPLRAITTMVLLIAALTSDRTPAVIQQAMESVSSQEVRAWSAASGEATMLARRRAALGPKKGTDLA